MSRPWQIEPNEISFIDETSGYPIEMRRHPKLMHWCAYIGIPSDHPWHGKGYDDVGEIRCHGGLTFAGAPFWNEERADWFFGFDCAHAGDFVPGIPDLGPNDEIYRDANYVRQSAIEAATDISAARGEMEPSS